MKLLLDTHTFLWLVEGSPSLSAAAKTALGDPAMSWKLNLFDSTTVVSTDSKFAINSIAIHG